MKLLTGLLTPTVGAGEPVTVENVALKRKIGVLPEDDALFRALTIWEHLEMSGPLYGLNHEETEARATQLLLVVERKKRKAERKKLNPLERIEPLPLLCAFCV